MDSDVNPEDDEVIHISTSSYPNAAKLQSTTLRNQFQLIEHRFKAKRGTPIHLPSQSSRAASTAAKRTTATSSKLQLYPLLPDSTHTALLPSSLNKIVRSTTKQTDHTPSTGSAPFLSNNAQSTSRPSSTELRISAHTNDTSKEVKKQKRDMMVEISSDEEDKNDPNRRQMPPYSLSASVSKSDEHDDESQTIFEKPAVPLVMRSSVVSKLKRKNGTDVGSPVLAIPKRRRSNWDVRSINSKENEKDSKQGFSNPLSIGDSNFLDETPIQTLPLVNIVCNGKRIASSPSKKQTISLTKNNEIVFTSQGLNENFEKKVTCTIINSLEFYVGHSGGLHATLNDSTDITAVLSPSVLSTEFSRFIQSLNIDNMSITPFEKAEWERTLEKAGLPVLTIRPPAYTKKTTELASVQPGDSSSKEQPSTQAVASTTTEPDRILFVYPFTGYGGITVSTADEARLDDGEFLNDNVIDFYMKWILDQVQSRDPELASQVHTFNSFFYKRLTQRNPNTSKQETAYDRVRKWTSKINLFDKSYVFIPINENWHWYLAIICNLKKMVPPSSGVEASMKAISHKQTTMDDVMQEAGTPESNVEQPEGRSPANDSDTLQINATDTLIPMHVDGHNDASSRSVSPGTPESVRGSYRNFNLRSGNGSESTEESPDSPWIFLLDSLGNRHPKAFQCLQQYLQSEAKERMKVDLDRDGCKPSSSYGKVPRQRNYCDCGVYLLHYVEVFLSDPQKYLTLLSEKCDKQQEWAPTEAHDKRQKIREVIHSTAELYKSLPK